MSGSEGRRRYDLLTVGVNGGDKKGQSLMVTQLSRNLNHY